MHRELLKDLLTPKYRRGDYVKIVLTTSHFRPTGDYTAEVYEAIICYYNFNNRYGFSYCVHTEEGGPLSWIKEEEIELIKTGCYDLLEEWEVNRRIEDVTRYPYDLEQLKNRLIVNNKLPNG